MNVVLLMVMWVVVESGVVEVACGDEGVGVVGGDGVGDGGPVGFGVGEDEESHGVECAGVWFVCCWIEG